MTNDAQQQELVSFDGASDDDIVATNIRWAQQDRAAEVTATQAEIATIEARMRTDRAGYNQDQQQQERLRELYGANEPGAEPPKAQRTWQEVRDEPSELPGDEPANERLPLPPHQYRMPDNLQSDELAQSFASFAGIAGMPEADVADVLSSQSHGGVMERDTADRAEAMQELQRLWGSKATENLQRVRQYVKRNMPPHMAEALEFPARRSNGRALMNDPTMVVHLHSLASRGAALPEGGDQLRAIEQLMKTNMASYRKDPAAQVALAYRLRERNRGRR